jgi:hypothetical protein
MVLKYADLQKFSLGASVAEAFDLEYAEPLTALS